MAASNPGRTMTCRCVSTCNVIPNLRQCDPAGSQVNAKWTATTSTGGGDDGCTWLPNNDRNVCSYSTMWAYCKCSADPCEVNGHVIGGCGTCSSGNYQIENASAWCDGGWEQLQKPVTAV